MIYNLVLYWGIVKDHSVGNINYMHIPFGILGDEAIS
jgi:hypothetical protein